MDQGTGLFKPMAEGLLKEIGEQGQQPTSSWEK
jgi:hypothetical protein